MGRVRGVPTTASSSPSSGGSSRFGPRGTWWPSRAGTPPEIGRRYGTPPDRLSVVYNGVDLDRFHPDHRARFRRPTREALGLSDRDWLVLFVGSGFERKGLGPLIEGWRGSATGARASSWRARATPRRISSGPTPSDWGTASTGSGPGRTSSGSTRWPTPWRCRALRAVRQRAPRGARVGAARADEQPDRRCRDRRSRAERLGGRRARAGRRWSWASRPSAPSTRSAHARPRGRQPSRSRMPRRSTPSSRSIAASAACSARRVHGNPGLLLNIRPARITLRPDVSSPRAPSHQG